MADPMAAPCPHRIIDDAGGAFLMGMIGGGIWHGWKGFRRNPSGYKFAGIRDGMRLNAPRIGGNFGVWCGLFSSFDCLLASRYVRNKEDTWNPIISGGLTGATLAARAGMRACLTQGAIGAFFLAMIEGLSHAVGSMMDDSQASQMAIAQATPYSQGGPAHRLSAPRMQAPVRLELTDEATGELEDLQLADDTGYDTSDFQSYSYGFNDDESGFSDFEDDDKF